MLLPVTRRKQSFRKRQEIDRCDLVRTIPALLGGTPFG
jgi:hypothetical protein